MSTKYRRQTPSFNLMEGGPSEETISCYLNALLSFIVHDLVVEKHTFPKVIEFSVVRHRMDAVIVAEVETLTASDFLDFSIDQGVYDSVVAAGAMTALPDLLYERFGDEIIFDCDNRPFHEEPTILEFIETIVREIGHRAMWVALKLHLAFKMSPEMWEDISNLCVCVTDCEDGVVVPCSEIEEALAKIRDRQSIVVDGVEYPVELDPGMGREIVFEPGGEYPSWLRGKIKRIGKSNG